MDPLQAQLNLQADLHSIEEEIASRTWIIDPWPLTANEPQFDVRMTSRVDGESYTMRIADATYPNDAPSIKCVSPETKRSDDPKAWPKCEGFRPPGTADLCLPISREGFEAHKEWANSQHAWKSTGNPIWFVLSTLQDLLNNPARYHARNS
jgi:hypothetical protein